MRVGILTFHNAENFGAVLQAYALKTFLQNCGCDAQIIDYRNPAITAVYDIFNPRILLTRKNIFASLHQYFSRFRNLEDRRICKKKYLDFRNTYLNLTKRCASLKSLDIDFDRVIVGSDQVWNLHLTGGFDKNYFLDFVKKTGVKKISYAASAEVDPCNLLAKHRDKVSALLNDFDDLSVREDFLIEELACYTMKEISVCLDPTFLLDAETYRSLSEEVSHDKYVLVYHMTPIPEGALMAESVARKNGWKVIEIHIGYGCGESDERHKVNLGPLEILSYLVHAEEVFTSSFHGLALSLIMNKNVWVVDKGNNMRQRNLLSSLNLDNRLLSSNSFVDVPIDYSNVNKLLDLQIKKSRDFLQEALFRENGENSVLS